MQGADADEVGRTAGGRHARGIRFVGGQRPEHVAHAIVYHVDAIGRHPVARNDVLFREFRNGDDACRFARELRKEAAVEIAVGLREVLGVVFEIEVVDHRQLRHIGA